MAPPGLRRAQRSARCSVLIFSRHLDQEGPASASCHLSGAGDPGGPRQPPGRNCPGALVPNPGPALAAGRIQGALIQEQSLSLANRQAAKRTAKVMGLRSKVLVTLRVRFHLAERDEYFRW